MDKSIFSGSKLISLYIRPPRVAIIIDKLENVENFITIACQSIGGRFFLPIPLLEENLISEEWKSVLIKYNPDIIYSFCELNENTETDLYRCMFTIPNNEIGTKKHKIQVITNSLEFIGQPLINTFLLDKLYEDTSIKTKINYIASDEQEISLQIKAYYGILNKNTWLSWQHQYINPEFHINDPDTVFERFEIKMDQSAFSFLYNNYTNNREDITPSILDITGRHLNKFSRSQFNSRQQKHKTHNIVVVSKSANIEDFCWFWTIRSQRTSHFDQLLPIWINYQEFNNEQNINKLIHNNQNLYIISKSLDPEEIDIDRDNFVFKNQHLDDFFSDYTILGSKEDYLAHFDHNSTQFQIPETDLLKYYNPRFSQSSYIEIAIPNYVLPIIDTTYWGTNLSSNFLTSKYGLSKLITQQNEFVSLTLPNCLQIIETIGRMQNYSVALSDKGKRANEIIKMLGDYTYIWIISLKQIMDLFHEMSNLKDVSFAKKLIREHVEDHEVKKQIINLLPRQSLKPKTKVYSALKSKINEEIKDNNSINKIINWLIQTNILEQGKMIKCPTCYTNNWISINNFNKSIICNGCNNKISTPFGIDKIDWEYTINSLFVTGFDQGILVHLLTGYFLIDEARLYKIVDDTAGIFFGMDFTPTTDNIKKEVDIVFVDNDKITIGECKVSGKELSISEISKIISFAEELSINRVVFSCITDFDVLQERVKDISNTKYDILLLGPDELYNQSPGMLIKRKYKKSDFNKLEIYKKNLETL